MGHNGAQIGHTGVVCRVWGGLRFGNGLGGVDGVYDGGMAENNPKFDAAESRGSEFSHGPGLTAPLVGSGGQGGASLAGGQDARTLSAYEQLRATRLTDPANPEANEDDVFTKNVTHSGSNEDGTYKPGTLRPGVTAPMKMDPVLPSPTGQDAIIDPSKYNPGHEPDGYQDGAGQAWRDSVPPNPVL